MKFLTSISQMMRNLSKLFVILLVFASFEAAGAVPGFQDRTPQVRDAIVKATPVDSAAKVTAAHLAAIHELDLNRAGITALKSGDFDGLTSLTDLGLFFNDLQSLPEGIFDNLTALTDLNLCLNDLQSLPADIFDNLTSLRYLNLCNNNLTTLPEGVFDNLTSLRTLDLRYVPVIVNDEYMVGKGLRSLPAGIFDNLTSLTELHLNYNRLTTLPAGIFDNFTTWTRLDLSYNNLTTLPEGIFDNLTSLTHLDLSYNNLTTLPEGFFANLKTLTDLNLNSGLQSLPEGIFDNLPTTLKRLSMSGVPPLPVLLQKVGENQFKAIVPTGAPFDIVLSPFSITNGSITGDITNLTIPRGSRESQPLTVTRTPGTYGRIMVMYTGNFPKLPDLHSGYTFYIPSHRRYNLHLAEPLNRPPVPVGAIPSQMLEMGTLSTVIVSRNFKDPERAAPLTYTAESDNTNVAAVSVSGVIVTLTPIGAGRATITVTASDGEFTATQTFSVTVQQTAGDTDDAPSEDTPDDPIAAPTIPDQTQGVRNQSPEAVNSLPTQTLRVGASRSIGVSNKFSDTDDDTLTYTAVSDNTNVATVSVSDSTDIVTFTAIAIGSATITVTASDGEFTATQTFSVTVQQTAGDTDDAPSGDTPDDSLVVIEPPDAEPTTEQQTPQGIEIPDADLRRVIETALGKAEGDIITQADMETLKRLDANRVGIQDLTGLEYAINLRRLNLARNKISDVSALSGLTKLRRLDLRRNRISDFSAIAGLTDNLTRYKKGNQKTGKSKSTPINADVNRDNVVDATDLDIVSRYEGSQLASVESGLYPDVNGDGKIDTKDVLAVTERLGPSTSGTTQ